MEEVRFLSMADNSYWDDAYYKEMAEVRLQEIENGIPILEDQLQKLHTRRNELYQEKLYLTQRICDHEFKETGCGDFRDKVWKAETVCSKCRLIQWKEF